MILVKENTEVEVVTEDMMYALQQLEMVCDLNPNSYKKIPLIKMLRILSKIASGKSWGLLECKIFIETHFTC